MLLLVVVLSRTVPIRRVGAGGVDSSVAATPTWLGVVAATACIPLGPFSMMNDFVGVVVGGVGVLRRLGVVRGEARVVAGSYCCYYYGCCYSFCC